MTNVRSVSTGFLAILVLAACASNGVPSRSAAAAQVDQSWAEADGALLAEGLGFAFHTHVLVMASSRPL